MVSGIKSVIVLRKNLIAIPSTIKKVLKTKIKSYGGKATDFHDKKIPKKDSNYTCLAVILIDFVLKKDEKYYHQVFLKEFKYTEKEKERLDIFLMT